MGNQNFSIMMQSLNTEELYAWAPRLEAAIAAEVPEIQDPSNDVEMRSPRVNVVINRDKAAVVGLNATTVQNAMYDALGPKWATTIYGDTAQYRVLLELDPKYQGQVDSLEKVAFKAPSGALVTLYLFGNELNIYSFVGLVMLIGIVKKNAIMQIDFALDAERKHGKTPTDAIYEGCVIRFRPIMMTTMAALFGTVPIALGYGAGGEARRPLGLAVVGGLAVSQLITLYLTPVVYTYMAGISWHPVDLRSARLSAERRPPA